MLLSSSPLSLSPPSIPIPPLRSNPSSFKSSNQIPQTSKMSSALDMSLDDLIKTNKKSTTTTTNTNTSSNPRFKGRFNGGSGPIRRSTNRPANRPNPYGAPAAKAPETAWKHDMYSDQVQGAAAAADGFGGGAGGRAAGAIETGTKLYISNLDYGVSNEDIKELFSEVGDLKRFSVHYDRSGRSKGTAEVVFSRRQDGIAAVKRYNNVQLDGKPMKIEIVGTNIPNPSAPPNPHAPPVPNWGSGNGGFEKSNGAPRSFPGRGGHNGLPRGGVGGGGSRGRGRGRGRGRAARPEPVSAADLDADLDKYHSDAMQI